ncbi:MAG TPA: hypothetical protein VKX39_17220 [Bryobacteraceae bacterium]|jgi:hypothetical protein|nr:hypothetical protein [Bryobacteraceae bacterium]
MPRECTLDGKRYEHGATACQNGREIRCNDGTWEPAGSPCSEAGPAQDRPADEENDTSLNEIS